ncbi:MAG: MarR family transcriptional regulator [Thermodesulfobacteriota bacterium]
MATRHLGPVRETRALDAYIALMRAAEAVTARAHGHLQTAGLTIGQFGALEALHHLGPLRATELARKLLRSPGNVTTVLDNLERAGLVRRSQDDEDRRCTTVSITARGAALMREIFPRHAEGLAREMSILTAREQEELKRLCRKLGMQAGGTAAPSARSKTTGETT